MELTFQYVGPHYVAITEQDGQQEIVATLYIKHPSESLREGFEDLVVQSLNNNLEGLRDDDAAE